MTPRQTYGRLALAEMVTWALLLTGMALKYGAGQEWATAVAGSVHGFVFLCYVVITVAVWTDARWGAGTGVLGLASAVVPFCTYPFEKSVDRRGLLPERWRLGRDGEVAVSPAEKLLTFALRRPLQAVIVALVVVAVVFGLLLLAGPPTSWFS